MVGMRMTGVIVVMAVIVAMSIAGAAGIVVVLVGVVHGAGVPRAGAPVNRRVIA
jgi:hypothetical protein